MDTLTSPTVLLLLYGVLIVVLLVSIPFVYALFKRIQLQVKNLEIEIDRLNGVLKNTLPVLLAAGDSVHSSQDLVRQALQHEKNQELVEKLQLKIINLESKLNNVQDGNKES